MGLAKLRNPSIKWNHTAMQKLAAALNDQCESLFSKGWGDTESYGQIFNETFQAKKKSKYSRQCRRFRAFLLFIYGAHIWELPYMGPKCSPPKTFLLFIHGSNIWLCFSHICFFLYLWRPFPFAYIFVYGSRFLSNLTF